MADDGGAICGWGLGRWGLRASALFAVVYFVVFALLVFALLNELAVAVDVDVEVLVQLDDALEGACLLLDGALADVELVGQLHVVLALIGLAVLLETVDDIGLFQHVAGEVVHIEILVLLEKLDAPAQHIGLVGLGDLELLGQLVGDELLVGLHHLVCLVVFVLPLAYLQESVAPVGGVYTAVGGIDRAHNIALVRLEIEDQRAFVQLVDVDALMHLQTVFGGGGIVALLPRPLLFAVHHLQEGLLVFRLEESHRLRGFAVELATGEIDDKEVAPFDVGMQALLVEPAGDVLRLEEKAIGVVEDVGYVAVDLVHLQMVVVIEVVIFLGLERGDEIAHQQVLQLLGERQRGGGEHQPLLGGLDAHAMQGNGLDGIGIEYRHNRLVVGHPRQRRRYLVDNKDSL